MNRRERRAQKAQGRRMLVGHSLSPLQLSEARQRIGKRFCEAPPRKVMEGTMCIRGTPLAVRHMAGAGVDCIEVFGERGLVCRMYSAPELRGSGEGDCWRAKRLGNEAFPDCPYVEPTSDEWTACELLWEAFPDFTALGPDGVVHPINEAEMNKKSCVDQVLEHARGDIPDEHMTFGSEDRFYFPACAVNNGFARMACWTNGTNVSLPQVDLVALVTLDEDTREAFRRAAADDVPRDGRASFVVVRYDAVMEHLRDRVRYQAGRAFINKDDWPSDDWLAANALDATALATVGMVDPAMKLAS